MEEFVELKYDFWPRVPQDIEKPASVAREQEFIWRLPLSKGTREVLLTFQVVFPFHFRYQPARFNQSHTEVAYPPLKAVYLDCKNSPLEDY